MPQSFENLSSICSKCSEVSWWQGGVVLFPFSVRHPFNLEKFMSLSSERCSWIIPLMISSFLRTPIIWILGHLDWPSNFPSFSVLVSISLSFALFSGWYPQHDFSIHPWNSSYVVSIIFQWSFLVSEYFFNFSIMFLFHECNISSYFFEDIILVIFISRILIKVKKNFPLEHCLCYLEVVFLFVFVLFFTIEVGLRYLMIVGCWLMCKSGN